MYKYLHNSDAPFPGAFRALSRHASLGRVGKVKRDGAINDGAYEDSRGADDEGLKGRGGSSLSDPGAPGRPGEDGLELGACYAFPAYLAGKA